MTAHGACMSIPLFEGGKQADQCGLGVLIKQDVMLSHDLDQRAHTQSEKGRRYKNS